MNALTVAARLELIIQTGSFSDGEVHDISALLCMIRNYGERGDTEVVEKCEQCLQTFINRKRMNNPVSLKKLRMDAGIW